MSLAHVSREFREIPLGLIDAPELPSRASMDEQKLDELTASIREIGLQQPVIVARVGDRYEVIAGHRRTLACNRAGLAGIPCIVYPDKSTALEAVKYAENRHREDLNPADEAIWFAELLERDCGGDVDALAEKLHEKRGYVESRLLLFSGDQKVFAALQRGDIGLGVAGQLNRCADPQWRAYLLHQAIVGGATVAVASSWIQQWQRDQAIAAGASAAPVETSPAGPVPELNYFRCAVCDGTEDVHLMQPINVHVHCKRAILDKLLASYRGE